MDSVFLIKVISAALYPLGLVMVFAMLSVLARWRRKLLMARACWVLALAIFLLASNPRFAALSIRSLEKQHPPVAIDQLQKHDVILVLGGGLRLPKYPAKTVQLGSGSDRYWHAAQLFRQGKANSILLTGGNVYKQDGVKGEAHYAAEILRDWGLPASAILIEDKSRTTQQNFLNSLSMLLEEKANSVILVTSAYHMPRALQDFNLILDSHQGWPKGSTSLTITPASADILIRDENSPALMSWIPSVSALSLTTIAAHEYYGAWFGKLKALMRNG